jgi:hypothetical protein
MRKFSIPSFLISVFLFFVSGSIFADSPCKDLSESKCNANNDCTWVKGYQKESGAKVDDYCRAKPGKGDDDDSKSDKKDKKERLKTMMTILNLTRKIRRRKTKTMTILNLTKKIRRKKTKTTMAERTKRKIKRKKEIKKTDSFNYLIT